MATSQLGTRVDLKNILFLTDFSEPSEVALPFAVAIAREYGAIVHALHILLPTAIPYATPELASLGIEAQEETADGEMKQVESQLAGVPHETMVEREAGIWPALERAIKTYHTDLIVLGTHGRTGAQKLLLGSVAEEVFRR